MVKIPRKSIGGSQLSTQAPAVKQQPGALSRTSRASQEFLQKTQEVAQVFENIQTLNEKTKAKTIAQQRLNELQQRALDQPDIFDKKSLTDEIATIKSETAKNITLPNARNAFELDYDGLALMTDAKINATLRKRQNADTLFKMFENIDVLNEKYTQAENSKERIAFLTRMEHLIDENTENGLMTVKQGQAEKEKQNKRFIDADIDQGMEDDIDGTIEQLQEGDDGIYGEADFATRERKLKDAIAIKNTKKAIEKIQIAVDQETSEADTTAIIMNKEEGTTASKLLLVNTKDLKGDNSSSYSASARRYIKSAAAIDGLTTNEDIAKIIRLVYDANARFDNVVDLNNDEEYLKRIRDIRTEIFNIGATGKFTTDDMTKLFNEVNTATKKKLSEATIGLLYTEKYAQADQHFSTSVPSYLRDTALREYFYAVNGKDIPEAEQQEILNNITTKVRTVARDKVINSVSNMKEEIGTTPEGEDIRIVRDPKTGQLARARFENNKAVELIELIKEDNGV